MRISKCVVCNSRIVLPVQKVFSSKLDASLILYCCVSCKSFFNPSQFLDSYKPKDTALNFHRRIKDRNISYAKDLFDGISSICPRINSVLEVGCGIGTCLHVAHQRGFRVVGYDSNYHLTDYGKKLWGLDLRGTFWSEKDDVRADLILCISTLEHQDYPRPLFSELCKAAKMNQGVLFVSVPFVSEGQHKYLFEESHDHVSSFVRPSMVHGHVAHYSHEGMVKVSSEFGAQRIIRLKGGGWTGYLLDFGNSIQSDAIDACREGLAKFIISRMKLLTLLFRVVVFNAFRNVRRHFYSSDTCEKHDSANAQTIANKKGS